MRSGGEICGGEFDLKEGLIATATEVELVAIGIGEIGIDEWIWPGGSGFEGSMGGRGRSVFFLDL